MSAPAAITPELVWPVAAQLGEGPVWLGGEGALRFVDIKSGNLHRFDPASGERRTDQVGGMPSFILPANDGSLVVGSQSGLHCWRDGRLDEPFATIPQPGRNRTNDATVDPLGRLWFGTMDIDEAAPTGAVWCLERGQLHRTGVEAVVTNGPAVSADGRFLYHVDSFERTIWRFPLGEGSELSRGEVFIRLDPDSGYPDGITVDAEDCLWVGLWDGWGVRRYSADGRLLLEVRLPCARVTKLAFGGADLRTAFVTTARTGLDEAALREQPLAGGLFAFTAPAPGLPVTEVRLD